MYNMSRTMNVENYYSSTNNIIFEFDMPHDMDFFDEIFQLINQKKRQWYNSNRIIPRHRMNKTIIKIKKNCRAKN